MKPRGFGVAGTRPPWPRCTLPSLFCPWAVDAAGGPEPEVHQRRAPQQDVARCILLFAAAHLGTRRRGTRRIPGPGSCRCCAGTAPTPTSDRHVAGGRRRLADGPGRSRAVARWYPSGGGTSPEVAAWRLGHTLTWQLFCRWFWCPPEPPPAGDRTPL